VEKYNNPLIMIQTAQKLMKMLERWKATTHSMA